MSYKLYSRIYSKLVELAKLEMQHVDKRALRRNLDMNKKSPVNDESQLRPKSNDNEKTATRMYSYGYVVGLDVSSCTYSRIYMI